MTIQTCLGCGYSGETITDARGFCIQCRNLPGPRPGAASTDSLPAIEATALTGAIICWVAAMLLVVALALAGQGPQHGDMFGAGYFATCAGLVFGAMAATGILWGSPTTRVAYGVFAGGAAAISWWAVVVVLALTRS